MSHSHQVISNCNKELLQQKVKELSQGLVKVSVSCTSAIMNSGFLSWIKIFVELNNSDTKRQNKNRKPSHFIL